jgi:hypothetical protein
LVSIFLVIIFPLHGVHFCWRIVLPMRIFVLLVFALSSSCLAGTESPYSKYPFAKYPARHYKGKLATPRLITSAQREFRTVIRRGAEKGPNVAGHYTVAEWGAVQTASCMPLSTPSLESYTTRACQTQMRVIRAVSCISGIATCSSLSRALRYSRSANRAFTSGEVHNSSRYDLPPLPLKLTLSYHSSVLGRTSQGFVLLRITLRKGEN